MSVELVAAPVIIGRSSYGSCNTDGPGNRAASNADYTARAGPRRWRVASAQRELCKCLRLTKIGANARAAAVELKPQRAKPTRRERRVDAATIGGRRVKHEEPAASGAH